MSNYKRFTYNVIPGLINLDYELRHNPKTDQNQGLIQAQATCKNTYPIL
jgi:hypothetical protein